MQNMNEQLLDLLKQGNLSHPVQKDSVIDLSNEINKCGVDCLNQDNTHNVANLFDNDSSKYLESDSDEQLLIFIPFKNIVHLHSIAFESKDEGIDFYDAQILIRLRILSKYHQIIHK